MTQKNEPQTELNQPVSFGKPVLTGAVIGLVLISFFLSGVDEPKEEWGTFWMIKPLIIVPLAGAFGGAFYGFIQHLSKQGRLHKAVAVILSLVVCTIILWMGTVLGLNGTLWD